MTISAMIRFLYSL